MARICSSIAAVLFAAAACWGCAADSGGPGAGPDGSAGGGDGAPGQRADAGDGDDAPATGEDAGPGGCSAPAGLSRGQRWVRDNPMFISGLIPGMDAPTAAQVADYYDDFGATATHFWADGLPDNEAAWAAASHSGYRFVTWTMENGQNVGAPGVVANAPGRPGRIGYQVGDEPVTMAEFNEHMNGVAAVRAADPDGLIILNFTTSRAEDLDAQLDVASASPEVDVLSYDLYTYSQDAYESLAVIREAALAGDKVYWRYLESYHDPADPDTKSESDMRWDAMAGAVYGYTGHTWFIYQIGGVHGSDLAPDLFAQKGSYAAARTAAFDTVAELNRQLAILGRSLSRLVSTDVRYIAAQSYLQPDGTEDWSPGAGGDPYITSIDAVSGSFHEVNVGFFRDDCGDVYVMLQNPHHSRGNFPSVLDEEITVRVELDFTGAPAGFDKGAIDVLDHRAGGVSARALDGAGDVRSFEATLIPGDVYFFKYRTGRPFAMQP